MEYVIFWIGIAVACGIVASTKGRSGAGWFFIGLLFSVIALIIILVLPSLKRDPDAPTEETHTKCPHCAEYIRREAIKCKHCGEAVSPQPLPAKVEPAPDPYAATAALIGGARIGRYWNYGGKTFESAKDVVEFSKNPNK